MANKLYHPHLHHRRSIRLKGYDYSQRGAYFITICLQDRACLFGPVVNGKMELNDAGTMIDKWWQKIPEKFPDIELGEYTVMPNHFHAVVLNTGVVVGANPRVRPIDPRVRPIDDPRVRPIDAQRVRPDQRVNPGDAGVTGDDNVNLDAGVHPHIITETERGDGVDGVEIGRSHGAAPTGAPTGAPTDGESGDDSGDILGEHVGHLEGEHMGHLEGEHVGSPLHRVVGWFKTMTTNEYIRGVKTLGWPRFNGKLWQRNYYEHIIRNERSYLTISNYIINNPAKWDTDKFHIDPSSPT